jgi:hypothetical protein
LKQVALFEYVADDFGFCGGIIVEITGEGFDIFDSSDGFTWFPPLGTTT